MTRDHEPAERDAGTGSFLERMLDAQPDALYAFTPDGTFLEWNHRVCEVTGYSDEEIADLHPLDFIPERDHERVLAAIDRVLRTGAIETVEAALLTKDGDLIPHEFSGARIVDDDGTVVALTGIAREITARRSREEELRRQRDELETLNRINALTQEVIGALVEAVDRESIERTVCEQLAASDLYRFAWTGDAEIGSDEIRFRTGAGTDDDFLRDVFAETIEGIDRPAVRAIKNGRLEVVEDIRDEPSVDASRKEAAHSRGIISGVAIPLLYGEMTYGVLVVGADRPRGFSERERIGFEVLGEVVSFAIHAAKQRHLLHSDAVTELEFHLTDTNSFFTDLSARLDCLIRLDGTVSIGNGILLYYITVTGASADEVEAQVDGAEHVEDHRLIADVGAECQFEFTITGGSPTLTLSEFGATVRSAVSNRGEGIVVAEVAPDENIRGIVERFRALYPDSELVAKREVERTTYTAQEFRQVLDNRLTERQRSVLQAAFFAGYYEWPRGSTAEELADSMGISSPTLHQHLRTAQQKLLETFFHEGVESDRS